MEIIGVKLKFWKCFDKVELVVLDIVFKVLSGFLLRVIMESFLNFFGFEYDVVGFIFRFDCFYVVVII